MQSRSIISVGKSGSNRVSFKSLNREDILKEMKTSKAHKIKEGAIGELERICMNLREKLPDVVIDI